MAACASRGCTPGNIFSSGAAKQKMTAIMHVAMVANVVMRKPPRHTPCSCFKLSLFCAVRLTQPFCMARLEVA